MSEFKWHMMAEEMPDKGKKDYLVMGLKGGLYLAPRFEGYRESGDDVWFRDTRGNLHYPDKVLAWAEVPKLEDRDAQESENAKLRELVADMWRFTGTACKKYPRLFESAAQGGQMVQLNMLDSFEQRMRELRVEVD